MSIKNIYIKNEYEEYIQLPAANSATALRNALQDLKIHQDGMQNPPNWVSKSSKLVAKILQNCSWEASWRGLGAILAPRAAQDQNIPPKPISGGPFGEPFWRPKTSQNQFFRVPRGVNFLFDF